jgi:hypothetical protein
MVAVLRGKERVIGTLLLANRDGLARGFDQDDLALFETLAANAGAALRFDRLQQSVLALRDRPRASRASRASRTWSRGSAGTTLPCSCASPTTSPRSRGASSARAHPARRVHPARRGDVADRPARPVRPAPGVRAGDGVDRRRRHGEAFVRLIVEIRLRGLSVVADRAAARPAPRARLRPGPGLLLRPAAGSGGPEAPGRARGRRGSSPGARRVGALAAGAPRAVRLRGRRAGVSLLPALGRFFFEAALVIGEHLAALGGRSGLRTLRAWRGALWWRHCRVLLRACALRSRRS